MNLATLCAATEGGLEAPPGADRVDVADIAYRADDVAPGALFACVRGARADGHAFAADAVARGAVVLVAERPLPGLAVPQVLVPDTRAVLGRLAAAFFGRPSEQLAVVGVTGTNGKTTTAFLLAAILEAAGRPCGLLGTVERRVGGRREPVGLTTPEAVDLQRSFRRMLDAGDTACAMEASSIAVAQHRLDGTRFAAIGFTNLTQDHLDFHGDMERYFAAKAALFAGGWPRAANADDAYGRRLPAELRYAVDAPADVRAERVDLRADGTRLVLRTPRGRLDLSTPLRGRFNVDNVLCAATVALLVDLPDEAIAAGVAAVPPVPGRFEPVDAGQPFAVIVDYAHTPAGIEAVLRSGRGMAPRRLLCVLGAGGDRDRAKRPLMGAAAERLADRVYVTSDNPRSEDPERIIDEILSGLDAPQAAIVEPDRRAAIARALADAAPGDVVVICGKGHEQGQEIDGVRLPFDDRAVARAILSGAA